MSSVKKASVTALCIALCCVLPLAFHALGLGAAFSPMHIPILLCGLICGWSFGLFCGVAGPLLSCMITTMPASAQLPYMIPELAFYGFAVGLLFKLIRLRQLTPRLMIALAAAMILGRIVGGAARMLYYGATDRTYSVALWASAYFAATLPGIITHLILIPTLYLILLKTGLISLPEGRTAKGDGI